MSKAIQVWLTEEEIEDIVMYLYEAENRMTYDDYDDNVNKIALKLEKALNKSKQS